MSTLGGFFAVLMIASFIVQVLYLLSIVKTINAVKTEHSSSSSILPWFILVPVIGWIVAIVVVMKLSGDYKLYVQKHEIKELYMNNGGQTKGLVTYISFLLFFVPVLNIFTSIVGFIAWIMYWIELGNMRSSIAMFQTHAEKEAVAQPIAVEATV
ncbi:MAG: hypothetical protein WBF77_10615 [Sulfurimonadaceae bacterium]